MNPLQWLSPIITSPDFYWITWLVFVLIIWFVFAVRVERIVDDMRPIEGESENEQYH